VGEYHETVLSRVFEQGGVRARAQLETLRGAVVLDDAMSRVHENKVAGVSGRARAGESSRKIWQPVRMLPTRLVQNYVAML